MRLFLSRKVEFGNLLERFLSNLFPNPPAVSLVDFLPGFEFQREPFPIELREKEAEG